jgi:hypothetical protein
MRLHKKSEMRLTGAPLLGAAGAESPLFALGRLQAEAFGRAKSKKPVTLELDGRLISSRKL